MLGAVNIAENEDQAGNVVRKTETNLTEDLVLFCFGISA